MISANFREVYSLRRPQYDSLLVRNAGIENTDDTQLKDWRNVAHPSSSLSSACGR